MINQLIFGHLYFKRILDHIKILRCIINHSATNCRIISATSLYCNRNMSTLGNDPTDTENWRGSPLQEIYRNLNEFELEHMPPVHVADNHFVLYHCPIKVPANTPPRPLKTRPKWDSLYVRLPCSTKSQYPVKNADGTSSIESRWNMIEQALSRSITNSHELQEAILSYNTKYEKQWTFRALHKLFDEDLDESESRVFFEDLLPRIIRLALQLPHLIQAPIPLLKQGKTQSVTLSQQQISCLLANAFLCTFPRRNTLKQNSEYSTFPDINFNRLFQSTGQSVLEKIKCICHYFRRVCPTLRDSANVPKGVVTFTRRSLTQTDLPNWSGCTAPLGYTPFHITSEGTIEDQGLGLLQVDFANKFLGGGVLGCGCVQEEIRFVICPELFLSKLITECLKPTEALIIVGCERYSNYNGYANTFKWAGNYEDLTPIDSSRRRMTHIVAIDALAFQQTPHQYREDLMLRELNKAYTGFLHILETPAPGVASGNWGCGAFRGDPRLKAILQLIVCSVTNRPLLYFTFGDKALRDDIHRMHTFLIEKNVRVNDMWNVLRKFKSKRAPSLELYDFIYRKFKDGSKKMCLKMCSSKNVAVEAASTSGINKQKVATQTSISINESTDVFNNIPNDENTEEYFVPETPDGSSSVSLETRIQISDDSETDELLASMADAYSVKTHDSNIALNANNIPQTPSKQATLRQRTLLEMLDQCYTESSPPASKRHCVGKGSDDN